MKETEFYTPSGVRLRQCQRSVPRSGLLNWLLLPGGPGIGSESLQGLADILDVPGDIWLVDLPGDGSNIAPPGAPAEGEPFAKWPQVLLEAAQALPNVVYVGHSTGGMYLLSVPELETQTVGLALLSTAPNADWRGSFVEMTQRNPLPEVDAATRRFEAEPTNERLGEIAVASAPWNFTRDNVEMGREFLARMPYNQASCAWSEHHFDDVYVSKWWPRTLPTLVLAGAEDRIVVQTLWNRPEFHTGNVLHRRIAGAAHFPWLENPDAVRCAFQELAEKIG